MTDIVKPVHQADYVLGHSVRELNRLEQQELLIGPFTRRSFREAGIKPGFRVLDIGSGVGDVSFLTADMVGADGTVVGIDRSATAVATARRHAETRGVLNVDFHVGDPTERSFEQPFDAVVGRYVLLFQPEIPRFLSNLRSHLKPGGLMIFHEPDLCSLRSQPPAPAYDRCSDWIYEAFRLSGNEVNMAARILEAFMQADLPTPQLRMETYLAGPSQCSPWLNAMAELAESLLTAMVSFGIATAEDVATESLVMRMQHDINQSNSVVFGRTEVCAWSQLP